MMPTSWNRGPRLRDESGATIILVALLLVSVLGMLALAVDLGMLYVAKSEAQRTADAATLAGTVALAESPRTGRVQRVATDFAAQNRVRGLAVQLLPEDIEITDSSVAVTVRRTAARGNPVPTLFAGVLGVSSVDVTASAAGVVVPTGSANCLTPFLIPDAWDDANRNGRYDAGERYEPARTGYGSGWRGSDIGRQLTLSVGSTDVPVEFPWYFLTRLPENAGGDDIRRAVANTVCNPTVVLSGSTLELDREPGAKTGPVTQGLNDRIALDPNAAWDATSNTIRGSRFGDAWGASPRVMHVTLFDPTVPVTPGMKPVTVTNFANLFLESASGGKMTVRLLPIVGVLTERDCRAVGNCAPFARAARLVR